MTFYSFCIFTASFKISYAVAFLRGFCLGMQQKSYQTSEAGGLCYFLEVRLVLDPWSFGLGLKEHKTQHFKHSVASYFFQESLF